jgi:hypothetical protein
MPRREAPEVNAGSMADIAFLLLVFFLVATTIEYEEGIPDKMEVLDPDKPKPPPPPDPPEVNDRDVLILYANKENSLLVDEKKAYTRAEIEGSKSDLIVDMVREFYTDPFKKVRAENYPWRIKLTPAIIADSLEYTQEQIDKYMEEGNTGAQEAFERSKTKLENYLFTMEYLGKREIWAMPDVARIMLKLDDETSYDFYLLLKDDIESGIVTLRDEFCKSEWGISYYEIELGTIVGEERRKVVHQLYPPVLQDKLEKKKK